MYKFRDPNENHHEVPTTNKTELQTFFTSYLSIASNVPFVFVLFLNTLFGQKYVVILIDIFYIIILFTFFRIPEDIRTLVGLFSISLIFIGTTAFIEVNTDACMYLS